MYDDDDNEIIDDSTGGFTGGEGSGNWWEDYGYGADPGTGTGDGSGTTPEDLDAAEAARTLQLYKDLGLVADDAKDLSSLSGPIAYLPGGGTMSAEDLAALRASESSLSGTPKALLNKLKEMFTDPTSKAINWGRVAGAGAALTGLLKASGVGGGLSSLFSPKTTTGPQGYQGGIPDYTAVRQEVPGTYDPTRRAGSSGQRYFTETAYVAPDKLAAAKTAAGERATGLAALNAANPAMQKRPVATVPTTAAPTTATTAPASSVIDRLAPTVEGLESLVNPPTQPPSPKPAPQYDPNDTRPIYPGPDETGLTGGPAMPNGGWRGSDIPFTRPYVEKESTPLPESFRIDEPPAPRLPIDQPQQPQEINYASGGVTALAKGRYLSGSTDGMADKLLANIEGKQKAKLSHGEFIVPADVVSHLGNGNSDAGAQRLYDMMDKIRKARTGTTKQGKQVKPEKYLPA